ncbi:MAG: hypothetical protein LBT85_01990 [Bifidobacteriaceae bacterium]|jgi:hypothetical protein|nr:hypothetical protein [Bifidobacteriaceae bacterium]
MEEDFLMRCDSEIIISYIDLDFAISKIKSLAVSCDEIANACRVVFSDRSVTVSQFVLPYSFAQMSDGLQNCSFQLKNNSNNLYSFANKISDANEKYKDYEKNISNLLKLVSPEMSINLLTSLFVVGAGAANALITNFKEMFLENEGFGAWENFEYDVLDKIAQTAQKSHINVELLSQILVLVCKQADFLNDSVLLLTSKHTDSEIEKQTFSYDKTLPKNMSFYKKPATLEELAYKAGSINSYTFDGVTNIQIMVKEGSPPSFTVLLPCTTRWKEVNGWPEDFNIMSGNSNLVSLAKTALETEMQKRGISNFSEPPVMLAGFSLGGLASAFFASKYNSNFNIKQVVSFGAPIGRFNIDNKINVLAYEFANDYVAKFDLKENPTAKNWETVVLPRNDLNLQGIAKPKDPVNVHQMQIYAPKINEYYPAKAHNFSNFLSSAAGRSDLEIANYECQLTDK